MRDEYYQSVGNPVQIDRLPSTRPDIAHLAPDLCPITRLHVTLSFVLTAAAAVVGVYVFCGRHGVAWLEPFDLLFAWSTIIVCVGGTILIGRIPWSFSGPFLAAVGLLALNHRTSWGREVIVVSIVVGVLIFAFGRHWIAMCVTSPVSRADAESLLAHWQLQLLLFAGIAGLLVASLLWFGALLFYAALLTLPLTVLVIPHPPGLTDSRWHVILDCLNSWFTYEASPVPGLYQGLFGSPLRRHGLTLLAIVLTAIALSRWTQSPLPRVLELGRSRNAAVTQRLDFRDAGVFERMRFNGFGVALTLVISVALPIVIPMVLVVSAAFPVMLEAAARRQNATSKHPVSAILDQISLSADLTERTSIYFGRVVADGSPVLVPRKIFSEHAHALGDSGSGKTSLFLCPIIEQLARSGDCSLIVLDLKGDSLELLASLQSAAEHVRQQRGLPMPLKCFSNQADKATFAFNPMTQPFWTNFDLLTRTDILCAACGLNYGADYGASYFSSANAAILHHALKTFPEVNSFSELADAIGEVLVSAKKRDLHPEIRKAGVHVHEVMKRLAACGPLNVTSTSDHAPAVAREAINLVPLFEEPQLMYFHLPATLSPSAAPEIARLANYMLLAAAAQTDRKVPVYLVIDEFQRMVASNLEYMLQLARSMGVGVILANQSLEDLKRTSTNLIPTVEANCRLRQWFAVSCSEDQERVMKSSGVTVDYLASRSDTIDSDGRSSESDSVREQVVNRCTMNDVLLTTDHQFRSFLRISRGAGYAQYGGMPVIIESEYHISPDEYQRRRKLPWPAAEGMFIPREQAKRSTQVQPSRPKKSRVTMEVIGDSPSAPLNDAELKSIEDLFHGFKQDFSDDDADKRGPQS